MRPRYRIGALETDFHPFSRAHHLAMDAGCSMYIMRSLPISNLFLGI